MWWIESNVSSSKTCIGPFCIYGPLCLEWRPLPVRLMSHPLWSSLEIACSQVLSFTPQIFPSLCHTSIFCYKSQRFLQWPCLYSLKWSYWIVGFFSLIWSNIYFQVLFACRIWATQRRQKCLLNQSPHGLIQSLDHGRQSVILVDCHCMRLIRIALSLDSWRKSISLWRVWV